MYWVACIRLKCILLQCVWLQCILLQCIWLYLIFIQPLNCFVTLGKSFNLSELQHLHLSNGNGTYPPATVYRKQCRKVTKLTMGTRQTSSKPTSYSLCDHGKDSLSLRVSVFLYKMGVTVERIKWLGDSTQYKRSVTSLVNMPLV